MRIHASLYIITHKDWFIWGIFHFSESVTAELRHWFCKHWGFFIKIIRFTWSKSLCIKRDRLIQYINNLTEISCYNLTYTYKYLYKQYVTGRKSLFKITRPSSPSHNLSMIPRSTTLYEKIIHLCFHWIKWNLT